jgi:uncharacterized DUF497 family protein
MYVYVGRILVWLKFHYENLAKHRVSTEEVVECFTDSKSWEERTQRKAYVRIGKTLQGRLLEVAYRKIEDRIYFVFHAMDVDVSQQKRYKKRNKL